jgi:hypothetical protein
LCQNTFQANVEHYTKGTTYFLYFFHQLNLIFMQGINNIYKLSINGVSELSISEMETIDGGNSGWYYFGQAVRWLLDHSPEPVE